MKKRKVVLGVYVFLISVFLYGCSGESNRAEMNQLVTTSTLPSVNQSMAEGGIYEVADAGAVRKEESETQLQNNSRKLIKTVSMDVETEEFDGLIVKLEGRVGELNGYIEHSNIRGNARYNESRNASLTIRIPSIKLDMFINEVAELSNITWKSENVEDITLTYVDMESRKKSLEVEQDRLLALLEKAESVEDIITIESRLSEVRYELQSYASQLLVYDNQVEYSTIYLNVNEVKRLTPQEEPTIWERIAEGFSNNLFGVVVLIENIVVGIIILVPYWGLMVIISVAAVLICRGISEFQKKRKGSIQIDDKKQKEKK